MLPLHALMAVLINLKFGMTIFGKKRHGCHFQDLWGH